MRYSTHGEQIVRYTLEDGRIKISFHYDEGFIKKLKQLRVAQWQPEEKVWILPATSLEDLRAVIHSHGWELLHAPKREAMATVNQTGHKPDRPAGNGIPHDDQSVHYEYPEVYEYLRLKGYSHQTIKSYMNHLKHFRAYTGGQLDLPIIKRYMLHILDDKHCSHTYANQAINAIKILLKLTSTDGTPLDYTLPRPKRERKLPKVLSQNEVRRIFDVVTNVKHKTALMMAYSCGLRVSEVADLKVQDIDTERMVVWIRQSKGRKDRMTTLSIKMKEQLEIYKGLYHPHEWLFSSQDELSHITARTLQRVFTDAVAEAKVNANVSFHSLRHSYATHLLESGVDLRYIQELLGHNNSKTTEIYTHVSTKSLMKIVNPLDQI